MKLIERLYKATMDVKRAIELPLIVGQTERLLDNKIREYNEMVADAELSLVRLRTSFVEADNKDAKSVIFNQIVAKKREIAEAKEIAEVAKAEKDELFAEVAEE